MARILKLPRALPKFTHGACRNLPFIEFPDDGHQYCVAGALSLRRMQQAWAKWRRAWVKSS
jgi:hypothetical protein